MAKGDQIGALWEMKSKYGWSYFTGTLDMDKVLDLASAHGKLKILIYETHPEYRKEKGPTHKIYLEIQKEEEEAF